MEIRNWNGKKMKWNERKSLIGWMTRTIVFAALLLIGFIQAEIKPGSFCDEHRTFTVVMLAAYAIVTAYLMARLYYRYEQWFEKDRQAGYNDAPHWWWRPSVYNLHRAFRSDGSIWNWLSHKMIPFGYEGRSPAVWVYGFYGALVAFFTVGYYFLPWYNAPKKPEPAEPPTIVGLWLQNHWHHLIGGVVVLILMVIIVRAIVNSIKMWHYCKWVLPHVDALRIANIEHQRAMDELLGKNGQWEAAYKALEAKLATEKQAAKENKTTLEKWGELIAIAAQLLKRVPAKRGDGDIGEARFILDHTLEALLITDETSRQASLYRAIETLDNPDRKRFQLPLPKNDAA